jgi:chromosome segregation ATPase
VEVFMRYLVVVLVGVVLSGCLTTAERAAVGAALVTAREAIADARESLAEISAAREALEAEIAAWQDDGEGLSEEESEALETLERIRATSEALRLRLDTWREAGGVEGTVSRVDSMAEELRREVDAARERVEGLRAEFGR